MKINESERMYPRPDYDLKSRFDNDELFRDVRTGKVYIQKDGEFVEYQPDAANLHNAADNIVPDDYEPYKLYNDNTISFGDFWTMADAWAKKQGKHITMDQIKDGFKKYCKMHGYDSVYTDDELDSEVDWIKSKRHEMDALGDEYFAESLNESLFLEADSADDEDDADDEIDLFSMDKDFGKTVVAKPDGTIVTESLLHEGKKEMEDSDKEDPWRPTGAKSQMYEDCSGFEEEILVGAKKFLDPKKGDASKALQSLGKDLKAISKDLKKNDFDDYCKAYDAGIYSKEYDAWVDKAMAKYNAKAMSVLKNYLKPGVKKLW